MRIAQVSAQVLEARPERALQFGIGRFDTFSCVLVTVVAEDGTKGYGEAMTRRAPAMTQAAVEHLLAPGFRGREVENIEGNWLAGLELLRRWGHTHGVVMEALSGVDIALWDLVGKLAGQPVWRLLHGAGRQDIPCYASSVYIDTVDAMRDQALQQVQAGFTAIKVKVGRSSNLTDVNADIGVIREIRNAVGPDIELMIDANGRYDAATAIRLATALNGADIAWFEEPVPPDDRNGYARIRQACRTPLATGETEFSLFGFRDLLEHDLIDVVQPDVARSGGITGARHAATLCLAYNKAFAPHTGFSGGVSHLASLHLAAAAPTLKTYEYMFIDNPLMQLFTEPFPKAADGYVHVPDRPGLGLDLDDEIIEKYTQ